MSLSARELELFKFADHYWTSDGYLTRLQLTFVEYYPIWEKDEDDRLSRAGDAGVILTQGRDSQGYALDIIGDGDNWIFMGNYSLISLLRWC